MLYRRGLYRAGASLPVAASILWLLAIGLPAMAVLRSAIDSGLFAAGAGTVPTGASIHVIRDGPALLLHGVVWSLAIGVPAALLGWGPGRALRMTTSRRRTVFVAALMLPIALPSYLLSWCWWQAVPPGSALGDWAIRHDLVPLLRGGCLAAGLLAWGWPLGALAVAALGGRGEFAAALALDGASPAARLRLAWYEDRRGLLVGAAAIAVLVFANTTAFDLAQVRSWGFELRTLDARGASAGEILRAAAPALIVAVLGGLALWRGASPKDEHAGAGSGRFTGIGLAPWCLLVASTATPLGILLWRLNLTSAAPEFLRLYARALVATLADAVAVGALAAVIAAGLSLRFLSASRRSRALGAIESAGWCIATLAPATAIVAALVATYNRVRTAAIYDTPAVALLGQLALVGGIAAIMARQVCIGVPRARLEALTVDGGTTASAALRGAGPAVGAAALTAFSIGAALTLGEVVIGARLFPPSIPVLATSILNAVHYQDPETVMLATLMQVAAAGLAAMGVATVWRRVSESIASTPALLAAARAGAGRTMASLLLVLPLVLLTLAGCDGESPATKPRELPTCGSFGNRGDSPGTFDQPRAIAADRDRGWIYVIDKTARVQRFDESGRFQLQWTMPEWAMGKPTGVTVGPDGTVWVADTHYHRVIAFDPEGRERLRFGRYGTGPGEFIYPTDIAVAPDGDLYVAEYGSNDRVQVFSPSGEFRFAFGRFGEGQEEFRRPQAIIFNAAGEELYIADSCNHRIVVTDRTGRWLRTFGRAGTAPGELAYPYGMDRLADGSLIVVEFGNQRVQRFAPDGRSLGVWGMAGDRAGQLRTPWGVAVGSSTICVLDSGNARVQMMTLP